MLETVRRNRMEKALAPMNPLPTTPPRVINHRQQQSPLPCRLFFVAVFQKRCLYHDEREIEKQVRSMRDQNGERDPVSVTLSRESPMNPKRLSAAEWPVS